MSARYRAAESVARDRKEPHVERREARISDRKEMQHASPDGLANHSRRAGRLRRLPTGLRKPRRFPAPRSLRFRGVR